MKSISIVSGSAKSNLILFGIHPERKSVVSRTTTEQRKYQSNLYRHQPRQAHSHILSVESPCGQQPDAFCLIIIKHPVFGTAFNHIYVLCVTLANLLLLAWPFLVFHPPQRSAVLCWPDMFTAGLRLNLTGAATTNMAPHCKICDAEDNWSRWS